MTGGSLWETWRTIPITVAFSRISPSQKGYFDVDTLFYSCHIHSERCLTYNWISITLCLITAELTILYCSVYILQVPYLLAYILILWYLHVNMREKYLPSCKFIKITLLIISISTTRKVNSNRHPLLTQVCIKRKVVCALRPRQNSLVFLSFRLYFTGEEFCCLLVHGKIYQSTIHCN